MRLTVAAAVPLALSLSVIALTESPGIIGMDRSYAVQSDSMEPTIREGDMVFAREVGNSEIEVGDVIVYRLEDAQGAPLISHRVVDLRETAQGIEFRAKGDNLENPDGWKSGDLVVGEVSYSLRHGGTVRDIVYSPLGFLSLVLLPSAMIVFDRFMDIRRLRKRVEPFRMTGNGLRGGIT